MRIKKWSGTQTKSDKTESDEFHFCYERTTLQMRNFKFDCKSEESPECRMFQLSQWECSSYNLNVAGQINPSIGTAKNINLFAQ